MYGPNPVVLQMMKPVSLSLLIFTLLLPASISIVVDYMGKRKSVGGVTEDDEAERVSLDDKERRSIMSDLCATKGVAKMGLARTLKKLYDRGLLKDSLAASRRHVAATSVLAYQRQVQRAIEEAALYRETPYGILLRELVLPTSPERPKRLHYIHPMALIYLLCSVNATLFDLVKNLVDQGTRMFRIVLFMDGINPGNPLAPDPQRLLQGIYWTFLEFPNWFLRRKDSWFVFSLGREIHINKLPGGLADLSRMIIEIFFGNRTDHSFKNGITISNSARNESVVVDVEFAGFLADEKGHKQSLGLKGQAGSTICLDCRNCKNRWCKLQAGEQYYWDPDLDNRKRLTTPHFKAIINAISTQPHKPTRENICVQYGINWVPTGILFSSLMCTVVDPTHCYLRDWMHTLVSDGVTSTEIALLVQAFCVFGINTTFIQQWSQQLTYPHKIEGNPKRFFKPELMTTDHVKHFAGDVITMAFLLIGFAVENILSDDDVVKNALDGHVECFRYMFIIICILRRGEMTQRIADRLRDVVVEHARLFLRLYGDAHAKPKFHHLYHLAEDSLYMLQCLSCFPTERKNKDALDIANATDREMEKTAVIKFLHQTVAHWGADLCLESYLGDSHSLDDTNVFTSKSATLKGGLVNSGDLVALIDGRVGQVVSFYQCDDDDIIYAQLEAHRRISDFYFELDFEMVFVEVALIVESLIWKKTSGSIFAIVPLY